MPEVEQAGGLSTPPASSQSPLRSRFPPGADLAMLGAVTALVAAAVLVAAYLAARGTPVHVSLPPIQGSWDPHVGAGTLPALVLAVVVVAGGRSFAMRAGWRTLLVATMGVATAWIVSLAMVDGWGVGFAQKLQPAYLLALPRVDSWSALLHHFTESIPADSATPWPTDVAGHPPGILLLFDALSHARLTGGTPASWLCVLAGSSAAIALLITARRLVGESSARSLAPFLALTPGAVWIGVSADAIFLGVCVWGIAGLTVAITGSSSWSWAAAVGGGALLGAGLFLSYGMVLFVLIAAVLLVARGRPSTFGWAALGYVAVVSLVTVMGFDWWDGYHALVGRYYAGLASVRPYGYWVWANLAALALACGPAVAIGLRRTIVSVRFSRGWLSFRDPANTLPLLVLASLATIVAASLSGMSKSEVERIWLPFGALLTLSCVAIPPAWARTWLAAQAVLVLLIQHLIFTLW